MRFLCNCLGLSFLLASGSLCVRPALADSYQVYSMTHDDGWSATGIYSDGSAVVFKNACTPNSWNPCFVGYAQGAAQWSAPTLPGVSFDNATACSFSVAGLRESGLCNGNYEAFVVSESNPLSSLMTPGFYAGALDDPTMLLADRYASTSHMDLNSRGDVLFDDVGQEEIYQAYNTTPAPEPAPAVLLATGAAACFLLQRRVLG